MTHMSQESWKVEIDQLLCSIKKGNKAAFEQLYDETNGYLFGLVLNIVADEDMATDVLQEAYLNVWTQIQRFNSNGSDSWAWLCQVFRNKAIDTYRQHQRRIVVTAPMIEREPYHECTLKWEANLYLKRLLSSLNLVQRKTLISAYVHGYSHQELAVKFQEPIGTIKSRIRRCLLKIKCLDDAPLTK